MKIHIKGNREKFGGAPGGGVLVTHAALNSDLRLDFEIAADKLTQEQAFADFVDARIAAANANVDLSNVYSRLGTLENLTTGLSRQNVSYCSGGSTSTKTILMS